MGTEKALGLGVPPVVAVAMGVMTGTAGGMIRDVLTGEIPLVLRRQIYLYATASLCGAGVFVLLHPLLEANLLRLVSIATTLVLRIAAIFWKLQLPTFVAKENIHQG